MNILSNYMAALLLFILSFMYFEGSMDAAYHPLSIRYGSYLDNVELIVFVGFLVLGIFLFFMAGLLVRCQVHFNVSKRPTVPHQVLMIGILSFGIIWMDIQYLHFFVKPKLGTGLLTAGVLCSLTGFYFNRKVSVVANKGFLLDSQQG